ncbi:hypothetical protein [Pseudoxanthomonas sp.]|uniref:hypothetical protein n=1 Tax=Pseudoxanthomonas sp. TaxID=1871049 RepID=UPI0026274DEF|nr:hypothetical protein [Pseudoxanthomonas sp.]WDS37673.1 MAG: hypothetical protein O8I58_07330 [Pseudoxanthomonas sp.]
MAARARQVLVDAARTGVEYLARGDRLIPLAAARTWIGRLEGGDQEVADPLCSRGLFARVIARRPQAPHESQHHGQHAGSGHRCAPAPAQQSPRCIQASTAACSDRVMRPPALHVANQFRDGGVTPVRVDRTGTGNDGIEVAIQPPCPGQLATGEYARARQRLCMRVHGAHRCRTGHQLKQHHAQAEHITDDADIAAGEQLRAGIRQRAEPRALVRFGSIQQARDAEIQQDRSAVGIDHHVARLEVAMQHQLPVGSLYCLADADEQVEPCIQANRLRAQVDIQGFPFDVLHHQIRLAQRRGSAVVKTRDRRMLQVRQDLAFARELARRVGIGQTPEEFDGDPLFVQRIGALGDEYTSHSAARQMTDQAPGADLVPDLQFGTGQLLQQLVQLGGHPIEMCSLGAKQSQRLGHQSRIAGPVFQRLPPLRSGQRAYLLEQITHLPPAVGLHA